MPLHPPAPCACEHASQRVPSSPQPANPRAPAGKPCPYADGGRELEPRAPCSEPSAPPAGPSLLLLLLGPNPGAPRGASPCRECLSLYTCQAPWGPCVRGSALGLAARARASSLHRAHDCTDLRARDARGACPLLVRGGRAHAWPRGSYLIGLGGARVLLSPVGFAGASVLLAPWPGVRTTAAVRY